MKAFLYILITFMFIGTAYSQETVTTVSATEIITKGKVIEGATYFKSTTTYTRICRELFNLVESWNGFKNY